MINTNPPPGGSIKVFTFDYPPRDGGISRLCGEIARALNGRAAFQGVLTCKWDKPIPILYPSGVEVVSSRPWREAAALAYMAATKCAVIAGIWYPEGVIAWLARTRPLIILAHGLELRPSRARWRRRLWQGLCKRVLTAADLVVANSAYTSRLVHEVAPDARVVDVPLAVDAERFSLQNRSKAKQLFDVAGRRVVTTVSRIQAYKGHDVALRALAALDSETRCKLVYLVAGRGPYATALKSLASDLGISEHVRWLGFVPERDLPNLYRASDLFVLCTRDKSATPNVEGFGLVFLESQACGTPVIGTNTGGIPSAVEHGRGGWLIEQDDVIALANHFRRLVDDPPFYEEAGKVARSRIEACYTWAHYMERFSVALKDAGIRI